MAKKQTTRRVAALRYEVSLFERTVLRPVKLSTALREVHPQAAEFFKDSFIVGFLGLKPQEVISKSHLGEWQIVNCEG